MKIQRLNLTGGDVVIYPSPPLGQDPQELFEILYTTIPWEQRAITLYGIAHQQPRQIAWYSKYSYKYSGLRLEPNSPPPILEHLIQTMIRLAQAPFNGILLNRYDDGQSSIGMHADDEYEFGSDPTIASLSLGATRTMKFQRKDKTGDIVKVDLIHGSVMIMSGKTQKFWKHGIDKITKPVGPRLNLTFRNIVFT